MCLEVHTGKQLTYAWKYFKVVNKKLISPIHNKEYIKISHWNIDKSKGLIEAENSPKGKNRFYPKGYNGFLSLRDAQRSEWKAEGNILFKIEIADIVAYGYGDGLDSQSTAPIAIFRRFRFDMCDEKNLKIFSKYKIPLKD